MALAARSSIQQQAWPDPVDSVRQVTGSVSHGSGWLDVLARILARASDARTPLVERARLLAVFSLHLDAFFMIRDAGTRTRTGPATATPAALPHRGLLHDVLHVLGTEHDRLLHDDVLPALAAEGLGVPGWDDLNGREHAQLHALFRDVIHPLVTPLVVDASHPFPHVSALSLNLGVLVRDWSSGVERFACVQVPTKLPGFVRVDASRLVCIDALVSAWLGELFQGMEVLERSSFRVTRSEEFVVEADGGEPSNVWQRATTRRRLGVPVRLEVEDTTSARMLEVLVRNLDVARDEVYRVRAPLGMAATILAITDVRSSGPAPTQSFAAARRRSPLAGLLPSAYATSRRVFLERATADPAVLVIAQTLSCRGVDSAVVDALIDAASAGKQVLVVLESRARDRERIPSTLGRRLVRAGCQVAYGPARVRGACALGLALRDGSDHGVRWYAHMNAPGNYPWNEGDRSEFGLMSVDPEVCSDVAHLLLRLSESSRHEGHAEKLGPALRYGLAGSRSVAQLS
jgi:polyphosphate kinase